MKLVKVALILLVFLALTGCMVQTVEVHPNGHVENTFDPVEFLLNAFAGAVKLGTIGGIVIGVGWLIAHQLSKNADRREFDRREAERMRRKSGMSQKEIDAYDDW